jgi:hypothetical protein
MLKRRLSILALAIGLLATVSYAQRKPAAKPTKPAVPVKKALPEEVVSYGSWQASGTISKSDFLRELSRPLKTNGTVDGFTFMYGERSMYEDSAGNPLPVTDYLTQYCSGDTLPAIIRSTLRERCKPGDTAFFSEIKIYRQDGTAAMGKPLKLTISK